MMFDNKAAAIWLLCIGLILGFVLRAFGIITWWDVPFVAIGVPVALVCILLILGFVSWMANGSH